MDEPPYSRTRIGLGLAGGIAVPLLGNILMCMPWFNRGAGMQVVWILAAILLIMGEGIGHLEWCSGGIE